jgi:hypothetical protein
MNQLFTKYKEDIERTTQTDGFTYKYPITEEEVDHVLWMCEEARKFSDLGKANRWLGFIQAYVHVWNIYTIDELRDHTREALAKEPV